MTIRVAINGFGRIGRMVLRAMIERDVSDKSLQVVAINDLASPAHNLHLLQYDSIHGRLNRSVLLKDDHFEIDGFKPITILNERNPENLPWSKLNIDLVLECSGVFTKKADATKHLAAGAKKVIISAPSDDADKTVVFGVNHQSLTDSDKVISNASCTTNCLAPVASVLHQAIGIEKGYMTTIHAFTGDQRLVDTDHKDLHRARAATLSMIPTSTGAAKAVGLVLPDLKGKLDGTAIRVPTANVSLIDFCFTSVQSTTPQEINQAVITAKNNSNLRDIIDVNDLPLVSADFNHNPHSAIFDVTQTQVIDGHFCRILAWYDNEWGFSNRMIDLAMFLGK